jgi:hypothetical protein
MAKHIACGDVVAGCQFTAQANWRPRSATSWQPAGSGVTADPLHAGGREVGARRAAAESLRSRDLTTYDPDTQAQDPRVLRRIVREFGGTMALDCAVEVGGAVRVGDPVVLL